MIELKPMDIIVVDGIDYNPLHAVIEWRCLDSAVHCAVVKNTQGELYDLKLFNIKMSNIKDYQDRNYSIHRFKQPFDAEKLIAWCEATFTNDIQYDAIHQWLLGFVFGMGVKAIADNPNAWTCAEFPYWCFTENGYQLTSKEEILPMPRLFRYNNNFECIYDSKKI